MAKQAPESRDPFQFEMDAKERLVELKDQFDSLLIAHASRRAPGRPITIGDLNEAYRSLIEPDRDSLRDAQAIITRSIRENRASEWISYGLTALLFVAGLAFLMLGAWRGEFAGVLAGSVAEVLFLFPLRMAYNTRAENLRIRILGIIIDKGGDRKTMATLLSQFLMELIPGDPRPRTPERGGE